jgi:hypothetical protein
MWVIEVFLGVNLSYSYLDDTILRHFIWTRINQCNHHGFNKDHKITNDKKLESKMQAAFYFLFLGYIQVYIYIYIYEWLLIADGCASHADEGCNFIVVKCVKDVILLLLTALAYLSAVTFNFFIFILDISTQEGEKNSN